MTDIPYMTLTQFRATGRDVDAAELEDVAGTELGHDKGGRVYVGNIYIESHTSEQWALTIMNDSWVGPLKTLEALLYAFARGEVLARPQGIGAEENALCDEWHTFCVDENLECCSADEMRLSELSATQRSYVRGFIERWRDWEHATALARMPLVDMVTSIEALLRSSNMLDRWQRKQIVTYLHEIKRRGEKL